MFATDPLSLFFLGCILFSGAFLLISVALGAVGGHTAHAGGAHLAGHPAVHLNGHAGHVAAARTAGHAGPSHNAAAPAGSGGASSEWQTVTGALLGSLNLFGILTFLLIFGLFGYLLHTATTLGVTLALIIPLVIGLCAAIGVSSAIFRLLPDTELDRATSRLEGRLGEVSVMIRAGGLGEVVFTQPGLGRQSIGARSANDLPLARGTEVVILATRDGIATVQAWEHFIASASAASAEHSPAHGELPPTAP